jgi:hypothetical protein
MARTTADTSVWMDALHASSRQLNAVIVEWRVSVARSPPMGPAAHRGPQRLGDVQLAAHEHLANGAPVQSSTWSQRFSQTR